MLAWLAVVPVLHADSASPLGTWHLNANTHRLDLELAESANGFAGTIQADGGAPEAISHISWDAIDRWLEFRRGVAGAYQWYRLSIADGVAAGRFSHGPAAEKPALTEYAFHVTGWSPSHLDLDIVPRTWRLTVNEHYEAVLRIDRDANGPIAGRLKIFDNSAVPGVQEELEYDLADVYWDGITIAFTRHLSAGVAQHFTGTPAGASSAGSSMTAVVVRRRPGAERALRCWASGLARDSRTGPPGAPTAGRGRNAPEGN